MISLKDKKRLQKQNKEKQEQYIKEYKERNMENYRSEIYGTVKVNKKSLEISDKDIKDLGNTSF